METIVERKTTRLTLAELESRVPAGSASRPIPKLLYRLGAPLRWWSDSTLRTVATEICSLPLRILAVLKKPFLRLGVPIPVDLEGYSPASPEIMSSYLRACSEGIQQLRSERPIISPLEIETYFRAFRQGAAWSVGNAYTRSDRHG
jgi:hypothetical protein